MAESTNRSILNSRSSILPTHRPPRILIVKLTAIGDVIHALPVATALRAEFPEAFIGWLAEGRAGDLLDGNRAIDQRFTLPRKWLKSPAAVWKLARELRATRFDVAIDLQGLTKSAIAAHLSGAPTRIGFAGAMAREASPLFINRRVPIHAAHVVDRYLETLAPLGIRSPRVEFNVPRFPKAVASVEKYLSQSGHRGPFAILNPGAGWPSKRWHAERFAEVSRHLGRKRMPTIAVWAGDEERGWAETIVRESDGHARLAPPTSLQELAELARRASLFVGADTGPLHLAAAVGTPCVGLFGPMPVARNGPYGRGHIAIQKATLSGTSRQRRMANNATMLAITVDDVCQACDHILLRNEMKRTA